MGQTLQIAEMEEITDLDSLGPEVDAGVIRNVGWSLGNYLCTFIMSPK